MRPPSDHDCSSSSITENECDALINHKAQPADSGNSAAKSCRAPEALAKTRSDSPFEAVSRKQYSRSSQESTSPGRLSNSATDHPRAHENYDLHDAGSVCADLRAATCFEDYQRATARISALPFNLRGGPLEAAAQAYSLFMDRNMGDEREREFDRLLVQADELPDSYCLGPMIALADSCNDISPERWADAFDKFFVFFASRPKRSEELRAACLAELADRLRELPKSRRAVDFKRIEAALNSLPRANCGEALLCLADSLQEASEEHRDSAFDDMFSRVGDLSDPAHRASLLRLLAENIAVTSRDPGATFRAIEAHTRELSPQHRAEPLAGLASAIYTLNDDERAVGFQSLLTGIDELPLRRRKAAIDALAFAVEAVPKHARFEAFTGVLNAVSRLKSKLRTEPIKALAERISELHDDERPVAFLAVLEAVESQSTIHRYGGVAGLLKSISFLNGDVGGYDDEQCANLIAAIQRLAV